MTKELLSHQEQLIKQILENQQNQLQQTKIVQEKDEEKKETFDTTFCFSPLPSGEIKDNITEDISLKDIPWTESSTPSDIFNLRSENLIAVYEIKILFSVHLMYILLKLMS